MKRFVPIVLALLLVALGAFFVMRSKASHSPQYSAKRATEHFDMPLVPKRSCARPPHFLRKVGIVQPVLIDLSQKKYTGIAFWYGKGFRKLYHPTQWGQYEHMGTYALDAQGNLYLAPIPYISIKPTTFNLQKNLYIIDSESGKLSIWMHLDDVVPDARNPYGIVALVYDCDDGTLWVSAIDKSDYRRSRGRIYHIDPKRKKVLQRITGYDLLSLALVATHRGKFLLGGSAREPKLLAFPIENGSLQKKPLLVVGLDDPQARIRKIRPLKPDMIKIETIPFSYTLIAASSREGERQKYTLRFDRNENRWKRESR